MNSGNLISVSRQWGAHRLQKGRVSKSRRQGGRSRRQVIYRSPIDWSIGSIPYLSLMCLIYWDKLLEARVSLTRVPLTRRRPRLNWTIWSTIMSLNDKWRNDYRKNAKKRTFLILNYLITLVWLFLVILMSVENFIWKSLKRLPNFYLIVTVFVFIHFNRDCQWPACAISFSPPR